MAEGDLKRGGLGPGLLLGAIVVAIASGCGDGGRGASSATEAPSAPTMQPAGGDGLARAHALGSFLAAHWQLPVPPQGPPPAGWSPLESSLAPHDCAACHPAQHEQWRTSLHAGAWSPGFSGQLLEGALSAPAEVRQCQTCHAPLSEQQPADPSGEANPGHDPALREQGIVCAACHVREHRRFGPPRRPELPEPPGPLPHGGFEARPEFRESRFCAECHQFFDDPGVNGKPIQNTYAEWQESPAAADGRPCQGCHMPDRAHLWRGIHDPEMVRAAVEVELGVPAVEEDRLRAALALHSRDVGHAFPTYVTPRVFLAVWQEDSAGHEIAGTRVQDVVGREIDFASWKEVFDTRIPPGGSHVLRYDEVRRPNATGLVGQVLVDPDFHYRGVFASLLETYEAPEARGRIEEAHRRTLGSGYVLSELRRPLAERPRGDPLRYRLADSGTHWDVVGHDRVLDDLLPRYRDYFAVVLDPGRGDEPPVRRLRDNLERRPVDRRNYDALNALAIGYFELNYRSEAARKAAEMAFLSGGFRSAHLLAIPWRAYGEIQDPHLRDAILDFYEDAGTGAKLGASATAGRLAPIVRSLAAKEPDSRRRGRIEALAARLEAPPSPP